MKGDRNSVEQPHDGANFAIHGQVPYKRTAAGLVAAHRLRVVRGERGRGRPEDVGGLCGGPRRRRQYAAHFMRWGGAYFDGLAART